MTSSESWVGNAFVVGMASIALWMADYGLLPPGKTSSCATVLAVGRIEARDVDLLIEELESA